MLKRDQLLERLSILTIFLVTISYAPRFWDPTVFPKVAVASVLGAVMLSLTIPILARRKELPIRIFIYGFILLLVLGLVSTFFSNDWFAGFFGAALRLNGFFSFHIAFSFILIGMAIYRKSFVIQLLWLLSILTFTQNILGLNQDSGFQLISAKNLYSPIIGSFGNPNYLSAFLGFGSIASLFLLKIVRSGPYRIFLSINILLSLYLILRSQSIQGLFMFGLGLAVLILYLTVNKGRVFLAAYLTVLLSLSPVVIIGLLGRGPLAVLLYQESTFLRFDYWRIALNMIRENPLFGVGPDQFGYAYITYRDALSVSRENNIVVDSAHNMLLQVASTYGLLYASVFFSLLSTVVFIGLKLILSRKVSLQVESVAIIALWLAFVAQSSISVDSVSALVPGFFFGGLVIGLWSQGSNASQPEIRKKRPIFTKHSKLSVSTTAVASFASLLTLLPTYNMYSVASLVRDNFSSPGTQISIDEINKRLQVATLVGNGDRYLWSRIANFRYGSGDIETARAILEQSRDAFPNYPTIMDFQAQLAVAEERPLDAIRLRKEIYSIDKVNIINIKEILVISRQLGDRETFNFFYEIGVGINASFFSDVETEW